MPREGRTDDLPSFDGKASVIETASESQQKKRLVGPATVHLPLIIQIVRKGAYGEMPVFMARRSPYRALKKMPAASSRMGRASFDQAASPKRFIWGSQISFFSSFSSASCSLSLIALRMRCSSSSRGVTFSRSAKRAKYCPRLAIS